MDRSISYGNEVKFETIPISSIVGFSKDTVLTAAKINGNNFITLRSEESFSEGKCESKFCNLIYIRIC